MTPVPDNNPEVPAFSPGGVAHLFDAVMEVKDHDVEGLDHPGLMSAMRLGIEPIEFIGGGGSAEVWRGIDQNTGRDVAIKVVRRRDEGIDAGSLRVLEQEANVLARLSSPVVPALLRRGGTGEEIFLVRPLVQGVTLDVFTDRCDDLPRVLVVCRRLIAAIEALHELGYAHGDIKPTNIMVDESAQPYLIDFGFSAKLDEFADPVLRPSLRGGTEGFLPPDIGKQNYSAGCLDLYALGKTLEAVTRRPCHGKLSRVVAARGGPLLALDDHADTTQVLSTVNQLLKPSSKWPHLWVFPLTLVAAVALVFLWSSTPPSNITGAENSRTAGDEGALWWQPTLQSIQSGSLDEAHTVLSAVVDADRDWAWRYLWLSSTEPPAEEHVLYPIDKVSDSSRSVGRQIAVGTWSGGVVMLDEGKVVWRKALLAQTVRHLAWSFDETQVMACDRSGQFVLVQAANGDVVSRFQLPEVRSAVVSFVGRGRIRIATQDGELLEVNSDGTDLRRYGKSDEVLLPTSSTAGWMTVQRKKDHLLLELVTPGKGVVWSLQTRDDAFPLAMDLHGATGRMAIGLTDGHVLLAQVGKEAFTRVQAGGASYTSALVFDPAGEVLLTAGDEINLIEFKRKRAVMRLDTRVPGLVTSARWDPVGEAFSLQTQKGVSWWRSALVPVLASR